MPKSTMEHEDEYKLPENELLPSILFAVEEKSYPYTKDGEQLTFTKWVWEFHITEGEYAGLRAWGETPPRITNREDNKPRQWAHALTGVEYEIGMGLDTDDLLGLPCMIRCDHVKEAKKGSTGEFYFKTPVVDVVGPEASQIEPPF